MPTKKKKKKPNQTGNTDSKMKRDNVKNRNFYRHTNILRKIEEYIVIHKTRTIYYEKRTNRLRRKLDLKNMIVKGKRNFRIQDWEILPENKIL